MTKVSFGRVIAVSAKPRKMDKLYKKTEAYRKTGKLIVKDVTDVYDNAASNGIMAQAAQRGERLDLFVTGADVERMKSKTNGWRTMSELVASIDSYINANSMSLNEVVNSIFSRG